MDSENGGLNRPRQDFATVGAWPASMGMGGTSGVFNSQVHNPAHHSNVQRTAVEIARHNLGSTSPYTYSQTS